MISFRLMAVGSRPGMVPAYSEPIKINVTNCEHAKPKYKGTPLEHTIDIQNIK
jgi:hypothetical protein